MHLRRFSSEARNTSYFERVIPGPNTATGQPPAGCVHGAPGVMSANPTVSDRAACGPVPAVGGVAIVRVVASSHCGPLNDPNTYVPAPPVDCTELSNTCSVCVWPLPMSSVRFMPATGRPVADKYAAGWLSERG